MWQICFKKKKTERKININGGEILLINIGFSPPMCFDQYV